MRSATPKVLHRARRPLDARPRPRRGRAAGARHTLVVVGAGRDQVEEHLADDRRRAPCAVVQEEQRGSGHAAAVALARCPDARRARCCSSTATSRCCAADTLADARRAHRGRRHAADRAHRRGRRPRPGYGRIVRDADGVVPAIVEEKDADPTRARHRRDQRRDLRLRRRGARARRSARVGHRQRAGRAVPHRRPRAARRRRRAGRRRRRPPTAADVAGLQRPRAARRPPAHAQRPRARRADARRRRRSSTRPRPGSTSTAELAPDAVLQPGTQLLGATAVARGAVVGPDTTLIDCEVGEGATVIRIALRRSPSSAPAPPSARSAYLRPGTRLAPSGKVGAFVETKNADDRRRLEGAAPVLRGRRRRSASSANIGAATVFANYDGVTKHRTDDRLRTCASARTPCSSRP